MLKLSALVIVFMLWWTPSAEGMTTKEAYRAANLRLALVAERDDADGYKLDSCEAKTAYFKCEGREWVSAECQVDDSPAWTPCRLTAALRITVYRTGRTRVKTL